MTLPQPPLASPSPRLRGSAPGRAARRRLALVLLAGAAPAGAQEILVSGFSSGVHRYDFATGAFLGEIGDVGSPLGITHGPEGDVYVADETTNRVLRFDGVTLDLVGPFVWDDPNTPQDEDGPLNEPTGLLFGENGDLYVASFDNDRILRYDGTTGAYVGTVVSAGLGGLDGPDAGMAWGPNGNLFVPSFFNHRVLEYDVKTGDAVGAFVPARSGGLNNPRTIVFRSDGTALVTSQSSNQVLHYDVDGAFLEAFVIGYNNVTGLAISPLDGNLYVSNLNAGNVRRFDGTDGTWEGVAVPIGAGGLSLPVFLTFHPDPNLRLGRITPGTTNALNRAQSSGATPGAMQVWLVGNDLTSVLHSGCAHLFLGVMRPRLRFVTATAGGTSAITAQVPDMALGVTVVLQVLEPATCRVSNVVVQTLEQG